jgi:hypothetical protein
MFIGQELGSSYYLTGSDYGSPLINLQAAVSVLSLIIGVLTAFSVKYWSSLVTNRSLFIKLLYINIFYMCMMFFITLWCAVALFMSFRKTDWSKVSNILFILNICIK